MTDWAEGDLALVITGVPPNANEYGHAECTVEAPDGTQWSAVFSNLRKVDPPGEPGSWEELKDIWAPVETCPADGQRWALYYANGYLRELK
jgi:hypothetical protein